MEKEILRLSEERGAALEERVKDIVIRVQEDLEDYHRGKAQVRGVTTGLDYVDKMLCGLGGGNGNYVVLSGRPGTGKTSLAMQIALHAALDFVWFEPVMKVPEAGGPPVPVLEEDGDPKTVRRKGFPVGVFSLEMKSDALVKRMMFQRAEADMQRWRTGFAEAEDTPKLVKAGARLRERSCSSMTKGG
jgi:replicative DNA helicase